MEEKRDFDVADFVLKYEDGEMEREEIIRGVQYLIDTGLICKLQGSYGRMANRLIEAGLCHK